MEKLLDELKGALKKDERFFADDTLLKNKAIERALDNDKQLLELLVSNERLKEHFFTEAGEHLVFDEEKFVQFVSNKQFLPNSYTAFKNKVGLKQGNEYLQEKKEVELVWPYKDCVLEGGQTKEDDDRDEKFWNKTIAPDQVDKLLDPKALNNFKRYTEDGEKAVEELGKNDNLFIRGNNLLAISSLIKNYREEVDLIYLDPPFNTGSDSFKYNDSFNHSTWLTFIKNRLKIAKQLLSEEGAIFLHIDHHEVGYLNVLMDELFGDENFVQLISVKAASPAGFKVVNPGPTDVSEYILFYTKDKEKFNFKDLKVPTDYDDNYNKIIVNKEDDPTEWELRPLKEVVLEENGIEVDGSIRKAYQKAEEKWGDYWKIIFDQLVAQYALDNAERVVSKRDPHKPAKGMKKLLRKSKEERDQIFEYGDDRYVINGGSLAFYSNKVEEIENERTPTELLTDFWDDISWAGIANEGGVKLKNGKKPEKLLKRIINLSTEEGDLVLDFFLGSGTTAAVAHKMNRQYIGIEQIDYGNSDPTVRLKNVIDGDDTGISDVVDWEGGGDFVYAELMQWNAEFVERIDGAESSDELNELWSDMKDQAFLSYRIDVEVFEENADEFEDLELEKQKEFLREILDNNQLYVNYSEIEDSNYEIDEETIELNKQFYAGG
jgi:adenine-specific DNA-methyltransferase